MKDQTSSSWRSGWFGSWNWGQQWVSGGNGNNKKTRNTLSPLRFDLYTFNFQIYPICSLDSLNKMLYVSVHFAAWCTFVWNPSKLHALSDVVHLCLGNPSNMLSIYCSMKHEWMMFPPMLTYGCLSHTLLRGGNAKLGWQVGSNFVLECYLVDPASNHMLVLKIKSCLCKYELTQTVKLRWLIKLISSFDGICYSDNYSKS